MGFTRPKALISNNLRPTTSPKKFKYLISTWSGTKLKLYLLSLLLQVIKVKVFGL